jgi:hypothetical protein
MRMRNIQMLGENKEHVMMKLILLILSSTIILSSPAFGVELGSVRCGTSTVGELYAQGWRIEKQDYIKSLSQGGNAIVLEDGTSYRADMTSGMLVGDPAILLSTYVRTDKAEGYIYNICAGGFDAWVTPTK